MTTPTEALKPCPFCGHETPYFERMGTPRQSCIVVCGDCGARHESGDEGARNGASWNQRAALAQAERPSGKCPDGLLPDGPTCPRCGGKRGPSGVDGGTWVHYQQAEQPAAQRINDAERAWLAESQEKVHQIGRDADALMASIGLAEQPAEQAQPAAWTGFIYRSKKAADEQRRAFPGEEPDYLWHYIHGRPDYLEQWAKNDDAEIVRLYAAPPAAQPLTDDVGLPPRYMLAKLQMVMPLFQEARDALTAITEPMRKLRGISLSLADRMDEAGTYSQADWERAHGIGTPAQMVGAALGTAPQEGGAAC